MCIRYVGNCRFPVIKTTHATAGFDRATLESADAVWNLAGNFKRRVDVTRHVCTCCCKAISVTPWRHVIFFNAGKALKFAGGPNAMQNLRRAKEILANLGMPTAGRYIQEIVLLKTREKKSANFMHCNFCRVAIDSSSAQAEWKEDRKAAIKNRSVCRMQLRVTEMLHVLFRSTRKSLLTDHTQKAARVARTLTPGGANSADHVTSTSPVGCYFSSLNVISSNFKISHFSLIFPLFLLWWCE